MGGLDLSVNKNLWVCLGTNQFSKNNFFCSPNFRIKVWKFGRLRFIFLPNIS